MEAELCFSSQGGCLQVSVQRDVVWYFIAAAFKVLFLCINRHSPLPASLTEKPQRLDLQCVNVHILLYNFYVWFELPGNFHLLWALCWSVYRAEWCRSLKLQVSTHEAVDAFFSAVLLAKSLYCPACCRHCVVYSLLCNCLFDPSVLQNCINSSWLRALTERECLCSSPGKSCLALAEQTVQTLWAAEFRIT